MDQEKAREILIRECEKHYNHGGCYTKCRCRIDGKCKGTTKDNKWNEELALIILEE